MEKTLFNRSRIKIIKEVDKEKKDPKVRIKDTNIEISKNEPEVKVKKKSPLGFYYWKTTTTKKIASYSTVREVKYWNGSDIYTITYLTKYGDSNIGKEIRPWDISPENPVMPDHQLGALLEIVRNLLKEIEGSKVNLIYKDLGPLSTNPRYTFYKLRQLLMTDLFGDIKGPRFQTDLEKIISHGFDEKTSFRK